MHGCWPIPSSRRRQSEDEAGSSRGRIAVGIDRARPVLGPDPPAMGVDDLLGDREPETGILAEALMRPVGVEALEDTLQGVLANARTVIVDRDLDLGAHPPAGNAHLAGR